MPRLNLIAPRFSTLGLLEGIRSVAEDEQRQAETLRTLSLIETDRLNQQNARIQNNILQQTGLRNAESEIDTNLARVANINSQISTRGVQLINDTNNTNSQISTRQGNLNNATNNTNSQITTRAVQLVNDTNNTNSQITTRAGNLAVSEGNLAVSEGNLANQTRNTNSQVRTRAGNLSVAQGQLGVAQQNANTAQTSANRPTALQSRQQIFNECVANGGDSDTCAIRAGIRSPGRQSSGVDLFNGRTSNPSIFNPSTDVNNTQPINVPEGGAVSLFGR